MELISKQKVQELVDRAISKHEKSENRIKAVAVIGLMDQINMLPIKEYANPAPEKKIKSIEIGYGESSIFYSTDVNMNTLYYVDEINQIEKYIGKGYYNDLTTIAYQCIKNGKLVAEIIATKEVVITFK